ncbi:MAG: hypothetical protein GC184_08365 [Rhizobiales bacterium]|nr:hypothetical protein [Hyphomicrobiales bacterium]
MTMSPRCSPPPSASASHASDSSATNNIWIRHRVAFLDSFPLLRHDLPVRRGEEDCPPMRRTATISAFHFLILTLQIMLTGAVHADERLTLVFVGDTGTNGSGQPVSPQGGFKHGRLISIADALEDIKPWLKGDMVFGNLESVVTDRNDLKPRDKMFTFRMHPAGAAALVDAGFNVFSTANNHAMDFGGAGAGETRRHLQALKDAKTGLLAFPGVGRTRDEVLSPAHVTLHGVPVAIAAFGLGGYGLPARAGQAGMLRGEADFASLMIAQRRTPAALHITSIHDGQEFSPRPTAAEILRLRDQTYMPDGFSMAVGHHPHVARGITRSGDHLTLYSLGNFLHFGTQNMGRFDICRDYGLLVRVGLLKSGEGTLALETVEVLPLTNMHMKTRAMTGDAAALRIAVLNDLSRQLDDGPSGTQGLQFTPQADGSGLWCATDSTATNCIGWKAPPLPEASRQKQITDACHRDIRRGNF